MKKFACILRTLKQDRKGAVAIITAIIFVPVLLYCAGMPIDIARSVQLRSALQNIADNAALAAAADLKNGATGQQACNLADAFVQASSSGLSVSYSSLSSPYAGNNAGYSGTNFASTGSYSTAGLGCPSTAPRTDSLANVEATAPYKMTVAISTTLPTTFMAFARKTIPIQVSATTLGAANFITMCVETSAVPSADYNQLYYYAIDLNGNIYNVGADGTTPATFTEAAGPSNIQFIGDDNGGQPTYAITPVTPCKTGTVKVYVHLPLATTIGFELASTKGGLTPCAYAINQSTCSYTNYRSTGGSQHYSSSTPAPVKTNFYTDAYGTSVFSTIRFYSTDYPATLNTTTTGTASAGGQIGDYSATGQTAAATTAANPEPPQSMAKKMFFNSRAQFTQADNSYGQTPAFIGPTYSPVSDLACMVSNGNLITNETKTVYNSDSNNLLWYTNIGGISNAQEENLAVANSAYTDTSTGDQLFQCPTTSSTSPYNVNPTCAQLNGATLYGGWNDMGGPSDNVAYYDLPFSFSCNTGSGIPTLDYTRAVIAQ